MFKKSMFCPWKSFIVLLLLHAGLHGLEAAEECLHQGMHSLSLSLSLSPSPFLSLSLSLSISLSLNFERLVSLFFFSLSIFHSLPFCILFLSTPLFHSFSINIMNHVCHLTFNAVQIGTFSTYRSVLGWKSVEGIPHRLP